jgi:hypothetical protein
MVPLARFLRRSGYETVNVGYFGPGGVQLSLRSLTKKLEYRLKPVTGRAVHFVTHSMGGIMARAFLGEHGPMGGRLVQLAPPNQGAYLANRVRKIPLMDRVPALRDLGQCEEGKLRFDLEPLDGIEVGVIAGRSFGPWHQGVPSDGVVRVAETYLPEARDWILLDHFHTLVMNGRDTWANVLAFLRGGRFLPEARRLERLPDGLIQISGGEIL